MAARSEEVGINLPIITFSFNPNNGSSLPSNDASVKTFVVSINEAADNQEWV